MGRAFRPARNRISLSFEHWTSDTLLVGCLDLPGPSGQGVNAMLVTEASQQNLRGSSCAATCRELQEADGRVARAQCLIKEREKEVASMTDQLQAAEEQLQAGTMRLCST